MTQKTHILVVEDEADIANLIKHSLEPRGHRLKQWSVSVTGSSNSAVSGQR
jgi:CheY-like chemotaxis protein